MSLAGSAPAPTLSAAATEMPQRLEPLLAEARRRDAPTLVSASIDVPDADPVSVYAAAAPQASLWMQPAVAVSLVGVGEAWSVAARGPDRFRTVSDAWCELLADAIVDISASASGPGPLLLGGFSFLHEPAPSPDWRGFEPASLVLPNLLYSMTPKGACLTLSLVVDQGTARPSTVEQLLATWACFSSDRPSMPDVAPGPLRVVRQLPEAAQWRDSVARLAGAVGRGRLDKAVLSRRVELQASQVVDVAGALRRLADSAAESTIFAFGRGSSTFLGATPERLVSLRGGQVDTMAMAGSAGRASDPAADDELAARLLESDKEREEHAVVVTMLRDALAPLTTDLRISQRPVVERFRHVQHLVTRISGQLLGESDVLALVERIHPTPAVAGSPRDLALELIAEEESDDRGWYAGPVGWLDQYGDGEFAVALRSGLVSGDRATLFAGCGIVADSDPDREWQESATKLLALSSALGPVEA